ncbi:hydroxyisourate hydrolase [Riemerella columbipharyngis]|uniref:5-hydroxyisourate hydrolase n=1 Tax=Riemerella columbipharyngis TaxID=1071918 RepID=A0A1G7BK96_9FLAO|nr:hydroxyisourate hydrolase [Riemerella columbipharyngis]SDE27367.1 5-hydroxyisourate hydrolase [Riemerella columbipharyngis]
MKRIIVLFALIFASLSFAQQVKYQLSSHILDITQGKPAVGVKIELSKKHPNGVWKVIDQKITDQNGRIKDFLKEEKNVDNRGIYKLTYFTLPYFQSLGQDTFYPFIEVIFEIKDNNHYHVPITLSPYGYSTYRGN